MRTLMTALALTLAAPTLAQGFGGGFGHMHGPSTMSPEGQATLRAARQASGGKSDRQAIQAIRDRILTILSADRLDANALSAAMADESAAAQQQHQRRQFAMARAFQQLSPADRKAFVADARAMRERLRARMQAWRARGGPAGDPTPGE